MAARDDILRELHLLPRWTVRSRPGLGARDPSPAVSPSIVIAGTAEVPPAAHVAPEMLPRPEPRPEPRPAIAADARRSRIAALEWPDLAADVAACTACPLCRTRRRTVPGVGSMTAEWLFVGEAPGSEEDVKGEPFVGQAGRLLDAMLAALGLARGRGVYIANVVKCRPPDNRNPEPQEIAACLPYLERQVELLRPRLVVALGKIAATALLDADATIASLRGSVHRYRELPLVVTYHPAYLLRTLADKAKAWEDLLLARRTMAALRDRSEPGNAS